jgi:hypothetical protein
VPPTRAVLDPDGAAGSGGRFRWDPAAETAQNHFEGEKSEPLGGEMTMVLEMLFAGADVFLAPDKSTVDSTSLLTCGFC